MRILIVNEHIQDVVGGSQIYCDTIARMLKILGHDVVYGAVDGTGLNYSNFYKVIPINKPFIKNFWRVINESNPDLIYWNYDKRKFLLSGILARYKKIKFVFVLHHIENVQKYFIFINFNYQKSFSGYLKKYYFTLKQKIYSRLNYLGYYFVHAVVAMNKDIYKQIPKNITIKILTKYPIDNYVGEEFVWPRKYILWMATLKKTKNPEFFIDLAQKSQHLPVDFLMFGEIKDENFSYLKNKENLPNNLHYLGIKEPNRTNGVFKNCLFFVNTCDPEGFGITFIQAWLQKKPTITLFYDPESTIERKNIGFFSKNTTQLVRDTEYLYINDSLREDMGQRAYEFAKENFDPDHNIGQLNDFLNKYNSW